MKQIINEAVDKKDFDTLKKWSQYQDTKSINNMNNIFKSLSELEAFTYHISDSN